MLIYRLKNQGYPRKFPNKSFKFDELLVKLIKTYQINLIVGANGIAVNI